MARVRNSRGWMMVELIVLMAVVGALVAIAFPHYVGNLPVSAL